MLLVSRFLQNHKTDLINVGHFSTSYFGNHFLPIGIEDLKRHVILQVLNKVQHLLSQCETGAINVKAVGVSQILGDL